MSARTQVEIRHIEGIRFSGEGSASDGTSPEGKIIFDGNPSIGGTGEPSIRPMESILASLAACASIDIVLILKKSKQTFKDLRITVSGERREEIPETFTAIELEFHFTAVSAEAPLIRDKITRAIDLSLDKYCSVAALLRGAGVTIRYTLNLH